MKISELFTALQDLASRARLDPGLEAAIFVDLSAPDPAQWHGLIKDGQFTLSEGQPPAPDLTLTASSDTAIGLFQRTVNPMAAFMTGKIKVKGDLAKAALLKQLLTNKK